MKPTIVIPAYNRPHALRRLLTSLQKAVYPPGVHLIISVDHAPEHQVVVDVARQFDWVHGKKELICHREHLGLVNHYFYCGDLTQTVGPIVLLEDDLYVSPMFYAYAAQALDFYAGEPQVAGISLNALWFNGYTHTPFVPLPDDGDVFFLQVAWFDGLAYTAAQWAAFAAWRAAADPAITPADPMHELFHAFPPTEWFPLQTKYLVSNGRYYVFPRQSLTTNFGDAGTHFHQTTNFFQSPLQSFRRSFRLPPLAESHAVYDSFHEIRPDRLNRLTDRLASYDYEVDLNGTKSLSNIRAGHALTIRPCRSPLFTFGLAMWPPEANVIENIPGTAISFCRKETLRMDWRATLALQQRRRHYFTRGRRLGIKQRFWWLVAGG